MNWINALFSSDSPPAPRSQTSRRWFPLAALGRGQKIIKKKEEEEKELYIFLKILLCTFIAYVLFDFLYWLVMALVLYLNSRCE